ncbi:MAG: hypothetical protein WAX14_07785 [Rhodococcus sp. (in: high G+C Gram-positive bacteria)]|uniref:hypothetical protein n=1 Tax=Rhodococcus sp. TaxID=1831 RepID=UPI003BB7E77C
MLPRFVSTLRQDRLGRLRTARRRGDARRARRRSLHVQSGRTAGHGPALGIAVVVPPVTSLPVRHPRPLGQRLGTLGFPGAHAVETC